MLSASGLTNPVRLRSSSSAAASSQRTRGNTPNIHTIHTSNTSVTSPTLSTSNNNSTVLNTGPDENVTMMMFCCIAIVLSLLLMCIQSSSLLFMAHVDAATTRYSIKINRNLEYINGEFQKNIDKEQIYLDKENDHHVKFDTDKLAHGGTLEEEKWKVDMETKAKMMFEEFDRREQELTDSKYGRDSDEKDLQEKSDKSKQFWEGMKHRGAVNEVGFRDGTVGLLHVTIVSVCVL